MQRPPQIFRLEEIVLSLHPFLIRPCYGKQSVGLKI